MNDALTKFASRVDKAISSAEEKLAEARESSGKNQLIALSELMEELARVKGLCDGVFIASDHVQ